MVLAAVLITTVIAVILLARMVMWRSSPQEWKRRSSPGEWRSSPWYRARKSGKGVRSIIAYARDVYWGVHGQRVLTEAVMERIEAFD